MVSVISPGFWSVSLVGVDDTLLEVAFLDEVSVVLIVTPPKNRFAELSETSPPISIFSSNLISPIYRS